MEKRKLKGILIDTEAHTWAVVEIDDRLESFYEHLHCDIITTTHRRFGDLTVCIFADDEGLFKAHLTPSVVDKMYQPVIFGSIFVISTETDAEGNMIGLSDDDCEYMKKFIESFNVSGTDWYFLKGCERYL